MNKAKITLILILTMTAAAGAIATKARDFVGYINYAGIYYTVLVPFDCPATGGGCIYTSGNGQTFQVYTLSGLKFIPLKP
jgi:hypothetical protein